MRIAVVFFGVARGVPVTIESIKRNIYACNPGEKFSFHTIASLNLIESIHNPRTGEAGARLNAADAFLLDADTYALVRQNDTAIETAFTAARLQRDVYQNGWISVRNALHQLASLRRAWALSMDFLHGEVDYFLFVRPDLMYLNEINLSEVIPRLRGRGNIALPAWHSYGGFNDRFALADVTAARHYAERLILVPEYCATKAFHPESFLTYALEKGRCGVCELPVRASRVRANGVINREDFNAGTADLPLNSRKFSMGSGPLLFLAKDRSETLQTTA